MAGFRPGLGRGGMIHSFLVTMVGVCRPEAGAMAAMLFMMLWLLLVLIASVGGAGARFGGEPAEDGVDTAGEAMAGGDAVLPDRLWCVEQN